MNKRVVCWDLDETLGNFRPVADEMFARARPAGGLRAAIGRAVARIGLARGVGEPGPSVSLRDGIAEVLDRVADLGCVQVVTTGAFGEYAELGLEMTGLRARFDHVFPREVIWEGWGKCYAPVRERYGVEPEQMLIIGDDFKKDRASDHLDTVMICDEPGHRRPAALVLPLIEALVDAEETFRAGFDALKGRAVREGMDAWVDVGPVRASIGMWGNFQRGEVTPVLSRVTAIAEEG